MPLDTLRVPDGVPGQIYLQIRKQILSGKMQGGVRLPSTRPLSKEMALSRITILNAFDQNKSVAMGGIGAVQS